MSDELQPARVFPPGEILRDELEARGWTQRDLARVLGRPAQVVSEIISGRKQITPQTSRELGEALGTSPGFWHRLESDYQQRLSARRSSDDAIARRSRLYGILPIGQMQRRGWLPECERADDLEGAVLRFLRLDTVEQPPALAASFRCANVRQPEPYAQLAWLRRVEQVASCEVAAAFSESSLQRLVGDLLSLTRSVDDLPAVPAALARAGIRLAFVPHLQRTYIDGAALWLDDCPAIALTLRYSRIDAFWFTLLHELAHLVDQVALRQRSQPIVDQLFDGDSDAGDVADAPDECRDDESAANRRAADWLVPPEPFATFARRTAPRFSRSAIEAFSADIGRHPGIVLGRLQKEGLVPYQNLRPLLVNVKPRLESYIAA